MASIGISDVVTASVYTEKTRMKKLMVKMIIIMIMIIIMNKSQETTGFHGRQKLTSACWGQCWNSMHSLNNRLNKGQKSDGRLQI